MRNFKQKRILRNILESWPVLAILGVGVLFFAWNVVGFLTKMAVTRENKKIAEARIADLEDQKTKLTHDIDKLNTASGVEASIREKFGLAREGEGQIIIIDDNNKKDDSESSTSGFFHFFTKWFK